MKTHRKMRYHTRWIILFLLTLFAGLGDLQAENNSDEIFGGQILTMTEETKSKIRIFLPFSWFIPALISFGVINFHQLSAGISPISI